MINYVTEDLRERIKALTDGRGADVVYDPVGGPYTEPALRSIAWRGRLLVVGFAAGEIPRIPLNLTLLKGARSSACSGATSRDANRPIRRARAPLGSGPRGRLKPHVSTMLPLERAAEALQMMATRRVTGKVVLTRT